MYGQVYCDAVLRRMHRLTAAEKEAIARELTDHMEDHALALQEYGWEEDEAWVRAEAAMGDPETMARELDRQYPLRWLVVKYAATAVSVVLAVFMFLQIGLLGFFWDSLTARVYPDAGFRDEEFLPAVTERVDYRYPAGNDVIRVYQIAVGTKDGERTALVDVCCYDRWVGGIAAWDVGLTVCGTDGQRQTEEHAGGVSRGHWQVSYARFSIPLEEGMDALLLRYEGMEEQWEQTISLPKEVGA